MAVAPKLADFQKSYDGLKQKLKRFESADVQRAWNDINSYIGQIEGALEGLIEAVADAQDQGIKGAAVKDYLHDKEVKAGARDFDIVYDRFVDQMKICRASAADGAKLGDDLTNIRKEMGKAFGQKPTGPDAKKITDLAKEIEQKLKKIEVVFKSAKAMPQLEKIASSKDKRLGEVVEAAKAAPRKPEKALPKDLKNGNSVKDLQKEVSTLFKLADGKSKEKLDLDELEAKLKRMEEIEATLRGALKDCKRTLKQAGHYDALSALVKEFQMPRVKLKKLIKGSEKDEAKS